MMPVFRDRSLYLCVPDRSGDEIEGQYLIYESEEDVGNLCDIDGVCVRWEGLGEGRNEAAMRGWLMWLMDDG